MDTFFEIKEIRKCGTEKWKEWSHFLSGKISTEKGETS